MAMQEITETIQFVQITNSIILTVSYLGLAYLWTKIDSIDDYLGIFVVCGKKIQPTLEETFYGVDFIILI